ncbi:lmo0937 family membrane protein [Salinibacillus aidingensis]
MLWKIFMLIILVWIIGLVLDLLGKFIHLLLIVALFVIVFKLGQRFSKK